MASARPSSTSTARRSWTSSRTRPDRAFQRTVEAPSNDVDAAFCYWDAVYRGRTAGRRRAGDDDPNAGLLAQDAVATVDGPLGRQAVDEAAVPAAETPQRTALVGAGQVGVPQQRRRSFGRPAGQVRPGRRDHGGGAVDGRRDVAPEHPRRDRHRLDGPDDLGDGTGEQCGGRGRTRPGGYRLLGQGQPERAAERGYPAGLRDLDGQRPPGGRGAQGRGQQPGAQPELRDRGRHAELDGGGRTPGGRREPLAYLADPAGQRLR